MAKKDDKKAPAGPSKLAKLLPTLSLVLSVVCLLVLLAIFAGLFSFGMFDVRHILAPLAIILVPAFVVLSVINIFLQAKVAKSRFSSVLELTADLEAFMTETKKTVDSKIQEYLGAEHEQLKADHGVLREQFDKIEKEKQLSLIEENEMLKAENEKLRKQLSSKNIPINDELNAVEDFELAN